MSSKIVPDPTSLNAKVSSIALLIGTIALLALATQERSLTPLRLLTFGTITFGIWAFCDEMGMRKPLIRAGFVAFMLAMFARISVLIEPHSDSVGRYYLCYAFALLIAMLIWSVAYLHRQPNLKLVGALGALASALPIMALIFGHVVLGAGAVFGIDSLMTATEGMDMNDYSAIHTVELMFSLWGMVTAWLLWRGQIKG